MGKRSTTRLTERIAGSATSTSGTSCGTPSRLASACGFGRVGTKPGCSDGGSSFFAWLVGSGELDHNLCEKIARLPTAGRDPAGTLDRDDALHALELIRTHATNDGHRDILLLLILTAQRAADIRDRHCTAWAHRLPKADGPVFPGADPSKPLTDVWHPWREIAEKATRKRVRMSDVHGLRHAGASLMLAAGVPMELIQQTLHHSARETTQIYLHQTADVYARLEELLAPGLGQMH